MAAIFLVHGAWHGPWCWDEFAGRLTSHGHHVTAVELRGHDRPPGRIWHRLRDYVEDLEVALEGAEEAPVLVGHSLGGLVVQKYLEQHEAAGAVLMASTPPKGTVRAVLSIAVRHPWVLARSTGLLTLKPLVSTPSLAREWFFTPDTPAELVERCFARLQDESYLAFLDTLVIRPRPARVKAPVLVLGAACDGFFSVAEVRATADAYAADSEIFPGMGHDLMLDRGWPQVADRVDTWIRERLA